MRYLKYVGLLGLFVLLAGVAAPAAHAQVRFGVGIGVGPGYVGPPPGCAYGYYGYYHTPARRMATTAPIILLTAFSLALVRGSVASVAPTTGRVIGILGATMTTAADSAAVRDSATSVAAVNSAAATNSTATVAVSSVGAADFMAAVRVGADVANGSIPTSLQAKRLARAPAVSFSRNAGRPNTAEGHTTLRTEREDGHP